MNTTDKLQTVDKRKRIIAGGISVGVVAAVIAGVYTFGSTAQPAAPQVDRPASVVVEPAVEPMSVEDEQIAVEAREAARIEAERLAAEEAARAAAEAAAAEAARIAAEQANQSGGSQGGAGSTGPVRCPAGSSANSSDGTNDTSCM